MMNSGSSLAASQKAVEPPQTHWGILRRREYRGRFTCVWCRASLGCLATDRFMLRAGHAAAIIVS